jgi:hypothetical protein
MWQGVNDFVNQLMDLLGMCFRGLHGAKAVADSHNTMATTFGSPNLQTSTLIYLGFPVWRYAPSIMASHG